MISNSVKLGINIYDEFNNIYSFNKSLTPHLNKIYFRDSNLVNIIKLKYSQIIQMGKVGKNCNTP